MGVVLPACGLTVCRSDPSPSCSAASWTRLPPTTKCSKLGSSHFLFSSLHFLSGHDAWEGGCGERHPWSLPSRA